MGQSLSEIVEASRSALVNQHRSLLANSLLGVVSGFVEPPAGSEETVTADELRQQVQQLAGQLPYLAECLRGLSITTDCVQGGVAPAFDLIAADIQRGTALLLSGHMALADTLRHAIEAG